MYFQLFIGSAVPIPEINRPDGIATHVYGVDPRIQAILASSHMTTLASDMGCGCGFRYAFWDEDKVINVGADHPDYAFYTEWLEGQKAIIVEDMGAAYMGEEDNVNQHQLADLLGQLLENCDRGRLYGCWEGGEGEPVAKRVTITPEQVRAYDFAFYPGYLYTVRKE